MGLQENLTAASRAVRSVQERGISANNDYDYNGFSETWSNLTMDARGRTNACVANSNRAIDRELAAIPEGATDYAIRRLRVFASSGNRNLCGNCGVKSASAYVTLMRLRVSPLDWMSCDKRVLDHAFVVIGRAPGSEIRDPSTWGDEAVVCDPWWPDVYAAADKVDRLTHWNLQSRCRWTGRGVAFDPDENSSTALRTTTHARSRALAYRSPASGGSWRTPGRIGRVG